MNLNWFAKCGVIWHESSHCWRVTGLSHKLVTGAASHVGPVSVLLSWSCGQGALYSTRRGTKSCGGSCLVRSWACRPCWVQWPALGPAVPGAAASSASPAPHARSPAWPIPAAGSHFRTGAEKQTLDVDKNAENWAEMWTQTEGAHGAKARRGMQISKIKCF